MKWSSDLLWLSDHCCWGVRASLGSVLGNSLHAAFRWAFHCFQRRCGQCYGTHCDITAIVGCFFFQISSQPLALGTGRGDLTGRHSSTTSAHPKCRNPPPPPSRALCLFYWGRWWFFPFAMWLCPPSTEHFVPSPPLAPCAQPSSRGDAGVWRGCVGWSTPCFCFSLSPFFCLIFRALGPHRISF